MLLDSFLDLLMGLFYNVQDLIYALPDTAIFNDLDFTQFEEFSETLEIVYSWLTYFLPVDVIGTIILFQMGLNSYLVSSSTVYRIKHSFLGL